MILFMSASIAFCCRNCWVCVNFIPSYKILTFGRKLCLHLCQSSVLYMYCTIIWCGSSYSGRSRFFLTLSLTSHVSSVSSMSVDVLYGSWFNHKNWHIYVVEIYRSVEFGAGPDNNPDLVEENVWPWQSYLLHWEPLWLNWALNLIMLKLSVQAEN